MGYNQAPTVWLPELAGDKSVSCSVKITAIITVIILSIFVLLGLFPWGRLRPNIESKLSDQIGQPTTIEEVRRKELWSLSPTVVFRHVRAPAPGWAGEGDLAAIEYMEVRFNVLPLLISRLDMHSVLIEGMTLRLVRNKEGNKSWEKNYPDTSTPENTDNGAGHTLRRLTIRDGTIVYDDRLQDRSAKLSVEADETGMRIDGDGFVHKNRVQISALGAPVVSSGHDEPWPFRAEIDGEAIKMVVEGEMKRPLSLGRFKAKITARADSLSLVDAIIEAGLMETQPVDLSAEVTRETPAWIIRNLEGSIGRSNIAGEATITKGERTHISGRLTSKRFDFDDLSSDEGLAKAAAKRARLGERLFPDTAIDLGAVDSTDGRLEISVDELLWNGQSPFRSMKGAIEVDRQLLTIRQLSVGLANGVMIGDIVIDQRDREEPNLDFTLQTDDARFLDFFPGANIDASMRGRIQLSGSGPTVREAIGRSTGDIAIIARDGVISANLASLLGQDVGRGLTVDDEKRASLRCIIARFDVVDGAAKAAPIVIDTSRALTKAQGGVQFADESLSFSINGVPKIDSVLRLEGVIPVTGTIKEPQIGKPENGNSFGEIVQSIGEAIIGDEDPKAEDADCDALAVTALR